jgi:hypothetical protein
MNMKSITRVLGITALMVSGSVFAQTQVPNTFQSGQPARAAEVNDNFSTLESAANQNASEIANNDGRITTNENDIASNTAAISSNAAPVYVVLDSTGQQVGDGVVAITNIDLAIISLSLLLSTGETAEVNALLTRNGSWNVTGVSGDLRYPQLNCAGQAHIGLFEQLMPNPQPPIVAFVSDANAPLGTPAQVWRATSAFVGLQVESRKRVDSNGNEICTNQSFFAPLSAPVVFEFDLYQLYPPPFTLQRVN